MKREELFHGSQAQLSAVTETFFIVKTMLAFEVHKRARIGLECWIAINVWNDTYLSVGAFLDQTTHRSSIFRPPIDGQSGGVKALQLRHVVFGADETFDRSSMRISERVTMVGSKEMMRDSLLVKTIHRNSLFQPSWLLSLPV